MVPLFQRTSLQAAEPEVRAQNGQVFVMCAVGGRKTSALVSEASVACLSFAHKPQAQPIPLFGGG